MNQPSCSGLSRPQPLQEGAVFFSNFTSVPKGSHSEARGHALGQHLVRPVKDHLLLKEFNSVTHGSRSAWRWSRCVGNPPFYLWRPLSHSWYWEMVPILLFTSREEGIRPVPSHMQRRKSPFRADPRSTTLSYDEYVPLSNFTSL